MHRSQYNSEDDSSSSSSDSGSSSSSSSDGSSSDDYSDSDGCEDEQDEFPVRQNGKQTAMEMERAARLLLSVSPALVARPRSMSVSHLEPLESLAGLGKLLSGSFSFFFFCGAIAPHTSVSNSSCFDSCSTASLDDGHSMSGDSNGAGSINKLHACLSGLTRGSRANYGSLASFQHDQTSLYSAMAPQSFLLSNLTRQRERTKNIKKLNKKKKKLLKKKRKAEAKAMRKRMRRNKRHQRDGGGSSSSYEPNHKKSKTTIIALPKDMRKKKSKKKKKSGKTMKKKIKVVDAAGKAALASAKLVNAPVNPECPDYLKAKYGEFFVLDGASGWYRLEGCGGGVGSHHSWNFCYFFFCISGSTGKIYNNFGRIGIYTPQQRLVIMNRYRVKRTNRQWKKVVRYDCRKNLADTRLRIKGRFVRRDSEEAKAYFANLKLDLVRFWTGGKHGGGGGGWCF